MPEPRWRSWARRTRIPFAAKLAWNAALSPLQAPGLVILNSGRCGSTVLSWMLHDHPRVYSHGEVFLRYQARYAGRPRAPDPLRYLRRDRLRAGRRHFVMSVHFLRGQHLRPDVVGMGLEEFLDAIGALGFERVALLERRNSLRVLLSSYAGSRRDVWHVPADSEPERRTFALDPEDVEFARIRLPLLVWLEEFERSYAEARPLVAARGGVHLTYEEDVLPDPRIGYRKLCRALGESPVEVPVPLRRANPFAARDVVDNFVDVARVLEGTRFAWMLEAE